MNEDEILKQAKARFETVVAAESTNRDNMLDDMRFRAASPDNHYQWPDSIRKRRESDPNGQRPVLTINKIPQHVNQVTNDIRQNRPTMKVIPVDDAGDVELAEVLNDAFRHIYYASDGDVAIDTCADSQVVAGVGYIRVLTDYASDDSFDQDIFLKRVRNPLTVYMDPAAIEPDGSDARYVFITELMDEDEFKATYPKAAAVDWDGMARGDDVRLWFQDKQIRVAEYWCVEQADKQLHRWANGATSYEGDELPEGVMAGEQPQKSRTVNRRQVCCYKLNGQEVIERNEWAGRWIPIARALGNEFDIEGKLHVSGLVRNAKDAQRMYNYWASQEVEMLALAPKAPFVGAAGQFDGFEQQWKTANTINHAYLEYNPIVDTDNGQQAFPPPQRVVPPMPQAGIIQAKMGAADDIKTTTGQYDASLGAQSNETSGRAILARQHEGDMGTFHFVDNLGRCVRHVGRIVLDLIPKIYDVPRMVRLIGQDESIKMAQFDPNSPQAVSEFRDTLGAIRKVYNPSIGRYDVCVVTGPSYTTKRQEALQAMTQMTQANPQLWQVIGDLMVRDMDWPGADKMAERLKAVLLPAVQQQDQAEDGQQIPPHVQQVLQEAQQHLNALQQQLQQTQAELAQNNQKLAESAQKHEYEMGKLAVESRRADIDWYEAETARMAALKPMDPASIAPIVQQLVRDALAIDPITAMHQADAQVVDQANAPPGQQAVPQLMQPQPAPDINELFPAPTPNSPSIQP